MPVGPMTPARIRGIVAAVSFRDWEFRLGPMGQGHFLQVGFRAPDKKTRREEVQQGRKWYVSPHATASEVVQTAWAAVQFALLHEAREDFRYKGQAIFGPHFDSEHLAELCAKKRIRREVRPESLD